MSSPAKHVLTKNLGRWLCTRCRKTGEKWWLDVQPCVEAAPTIRAPIVCAEDRAAAQARATMILGSKFKP